MISRRAQQGMEVGGVAGAVVGGAAPAVPMVISLIGLGMAAVAGAPEVAGMLAVGAIIWAGGVVIGVPAGGLTGALGAAVGVVESGLNKASNFYSFWRNPAPEVVASHTNEIEADASNISIVRLNN